MVTITQEGKLSAPQSNGLFQNVKFWFSMMVPGRNNLITSVTTNGGKVVPIERDADVCIVDHARPPDPAVVNNPLDMYSYNLIKDSIANAHFSPDNARAYLVDLTTAHAAKRLSSSTGRANTARPLAKAIGGGSEAKRPRGRKFFNLQDDLVLLHYISRPGVHLFGNKVYREIEAQHPSHTYHGWRGRWTDFYSKQNPDPVYWYEKLKKDAGLADSDDWDPNPESEPEPEPPLPAAAKTPPRRSLPKQKAQPLPARAPPPVCAPRRAIAATTTAITTTNTNTATTATVTATATATAPAAGDEFTDEDDRILEEFHPTVEEAADPLEAWEQLEDQYPHHRASRWRRRYNQVVLPRLQSASAAPPAPADRSKPGPRLAPSHPPIPGPADLPPPSAPATTAAAAAAAGLAAKSLSSEASRQSSEDYIENWRRDVTGKGAAQARPTPASAATPRKRRRSASPALPPDAEIPSTPEPVPAIKRLRRREPSPELGPSLHPLQVLDSDDDFQPQSPPPLPSPPPQPQLQPKEPEPESEEPQSEDPDLIVPPLDIPTPSMFVEDSSSRESSPEPAEFFAMLIEKYPGTTGERIGWALQRAGADEKLAEAVIASVHAGRGLPDRAGVWSEEDDAVLVGRDYNAIAELETRKADFMERLEFLRQWSEQLRS